MPETQSSDLRHISQRLDELAQGQAEIRDAVMGHADGLGLKGRTDRLEQAVEAMRWLVKTALGGVVVALGLAIWNKLKGL